MRPVLVQKILNWVNIENSSDPVSIIITRALSGVLTRNGVGITRCPKCKESNIVRDNRLQCPCKFTANVIDCACRCGGQLLDRGKNGIPRRYLKGHQICGQNNPNYHGGRSKRGEYCLVSAPKHREADRDGYVLEHRLVYEQHYKCCLLPWSSIHHLDRNTKNNNIDNLILTSTREHHHKFHKEDCGQVCQNCKSSEYVVKHGGIRYGKQGFKCKHCRKWWGVPISDLVIKKPDNNLRCEEYLRGLETDEEI